jgi:N-acylneuraminate cytidylyltransferase/CMP-N,N'-diacetyllegionaminic acid synthase
MINDFKVLAVIPARSGSKGLPGKNIKELCGKPLVAWSVDAAKESKYIDKIVVSTDSDEIAEIGKKYGAEVPFMRPAELARDTSPGYEVLEHVILTLQEMGDCYDFIVVLEPTSPLREVSDIDNSLETLVNNIKRAESIVGVCALDATHPEFLVTINPEGFLSLYGGKKFSEPTRRQDLSKLYFFEGTIYISTIEALFKNKGFCHEKTLAYIVPKWKAFEVDDLIDFFCVEAVLKNKSMFQ